MNRYIVIALIATLCSSCSTTPSPPDRQDKSLVIASCPQLTVLEDPSFGATTRKLLEVIGQYYLCRSAALGDASLPSAR